MVCLVSQERPEGCGRAVGSGKMQPLFDSIEPTLSRRLSTRHHEPQQQHRMAPFQKPLVKLQLFMAHKLLPTPRWYEYRWVPLPRPYEPPPWPYWDSWVTYRQQFSRASSTSHHRKGQPTSSARSRRRDPQEESCGANEEVSPIANVFSSSIGEAVMPPPPSLTDDFEHV
ncbi:hypothetical protein UY3_05948 [Chelonia mydas]|uniref:Uncharacterized protein n=1 Tax=Chelonia mydas TaxID=8469 RepID=M7BI61_CHEMY|nr:hypothetical protein UY3_05948 [Chelonia mydas]